MIIEVNYATFQYSPTLICVTLFWIFDYILPVSPKLIGPYIFFVLPLKLKGITELNISFSKEVMIRNHPTCIYILVHYNNISQSIIQLVWVVRPQAKSLLLQFCMFLMQFCWQKELFLFNQQLFSMVEERKGLYSSFLFSCVNQVSFLA